MGRLEAESGKTEMATLRSSTYRLECVEGKGVKSAAQAQGLPQTSSSRRGRSSTAPPTPPPLPRSTAGVRGRGRRAARREASREAPSQPWPRRPAAGMAPSCRRGKGTGSGSAEACGAATDEWSSPVGSPLPFSRGASLDAGWVSAMATGGGGGGGGRGAQRRRCRAASEAERAVTEAPAAATLRGRAGVGVTSSTMARAPRGDTGTVGGGTRGRCVVSQLSEGYWGQGQGGGAQAV